MSSSPVAAAPSAPWQRSSRLLLTVLLALGVIGLFAGYWGVSGTRELSDQVVWVNVASAGLLLAGAGIVFFLAAGRRAVGRRRLTMFGDVPSASAVGLAATQLPGGALLAAKNMTRYHRADCAFVTGKPAQPATATAHEQAGRKPCGVCLSGVEEVSG